MVVEHETEFRGRKMRIGRPLIDEHGHLAFFIGYCPDCHGKCSVSGEEARRLMRMFGSAKHRPLQRMAIRLLKKYAGPAY
jgi:hypothetical protein